MIRAIILGIYYLLAIGSIGLVGIPYSFMVGNVEWLYRQAMRAAWFGVKMIGVDVEVIGRERFDPNGTYIYMCNHVSNLDPPIVVPSIPRRTSVLVKKEVFRIPLLSKAMLMARFVPVDRRNRDAAIASIHEATEVMKTGVNMTIFPEGTRSPDGKLLPFKKGPFHLAQESGVSIVPMTIHGTETLMPKKGFAIKPGKATLVFHSPIDPKQFGDRDAISEAVYERIESALPERLRR
jgi:1-acyl-sn-glycerol-3-phosphate acyltransferase